MIDKCWLVLLIYYTVKSYTQLEVGNKEAFEDIEEVVISVENWCAYWRKL